MSDPAEPTADPTNPDATLRYTQRLRQSADFAAAEQVIAWALDFNPEHGGLLRRMSELGLDKGDIAQALSWAERAVAANARETQNQVHLAAVLTRLGRFKEAEAALEAAVSLDPENTGSLRRLSELKMRLGQTEEAFLLVRQAVAARPKELQNYVHLADLQRGSGQLDDAEATIHYSLEIEPAQPGLLRRLSDYASRRGDPHLAESWAERAIEVNRNDAGSYTHLANLYAARNDFHSAESALRQALEVAPGNAGIKRRISEILMRRGETDASFAWAEKLISEHANDPASHIHLAALYLGQNKRDEAEAALRKAVDIATNGVVAAAPMRRLSEMALSRGDIDGAFQWAHRSLDANPYEAASHSHLASIHLLYGNLAAAEVITLSVIELSPRNVGQLRRLSDIRLRRGDPNGALDWARQAVAADPLDSGSYNNLATVLLAQGNLVDAHAAALRAAELAPQNLTFTRRVGYFAALRSDEGS